MSDRSGHLSPRLRAAHDDECAAACIASASSRSADQLRSFLDSVKTDRLYGLFMLASLTGLRRGELLALQWPDVDLDRGLIAVQRSRVAVGYDVFEGTPKSGRARTVAIDPGTVAALRSHRSRQARDRLRWGDAWQDLGYLFTHKDGRALHPSSVSEMFKRRCSAANLVSIPFHGLRHTHATLGLAAGISPKVMAERLGHANVSITLDIYSHVLPGMQEDAAQRIAMLLFPR